MDLSDDRPIVLKRGALLAAKKLAAKRKLRDLAINAGQGKLAVRKQSEDYAADAIATVGGTQTEKTRKGKEPVVIEPLHRLPWDIFLFMLLVYVAVSVPCACAARPVLNSVPTCSNPLMRSRVTLMCSPLTDRLGFGVPAHGAMFAFETSIDMCFLADVILNFRTVVVTRDIEIREPRKIARQYMSSWFLIGAWELSTV